MPPAANDNQGLKIAVAAFVTLTVVLAVTTYFGFSNASFNEGKMNEALTKANDSDKVARELQTSLNDFKEATGYAKADDATLKDAVKKTSDDLTKKVADLQAKVRKAVADYKSKAGSNVAEVDKLSQSADTIFNSFTTEPNRTLVSSLDRMMELMDNLSLLSNAISQDYVDVRTRLEQTDQANAAQLASANEAKEKTQQDLANVHGEAEKARQTLASQNDQLQTDNAKLVGERDQLKRELESERERNKKTEGDMKTQLAYLRQEFDKKNTVLDQRDGLVTYVDYGRNEVRTDISRRMGAREQMVFSVFDRDAPGLPTDRPKATIELIQVTDRGSIGRITKVMSTVNPIRERDQVYSPSWSPNRPERFALIGKIDVDRDGRDDRADLRRMIQSSGGVIDYDLPPPGIGTEQGEISALTSWYVTDDRQPIHPSSTSRERASNRDETEFLTKRSDAISRAMSFSVRPMPVERLLAYLGYTYGQTVTGRVEAADRRTMEGLLNPRGATAPRPADAGRTSQPAEKKEDEETP